MLGNQLNILYDEVPSNQNEAQKLESTKDEKKDKEESNTNKRKRKRGGD